MKQRMAARLGWSLWGLFLLLAGAGVWFVALGRPTSVVVENAAYVLIFLAIGAVGALVVSRQPRNAFGWVFLATTMAAAIAFFTSEYGHYSFRIRSAPLPGALLAAWIGDWAWLPVYTLPTTFVLLLFPDGRLPSPRWKPFAWFTGLFIGLAGMVFAFGPTIAGTSLPNPVAIEALRPIQDSFETVSYPIILALSLISAGSMVVRFRRARGEQRQQIKWFAVAAVFLTVEFLLSAIRDTVFHADWGVFGTMLDALAFLALPVAAGVAILRYRLYDVDVVINRALLFGLLAVFITAVYVGIVVGVGTLIGSRGNVFLSIVATALIAVAFQPVTVRARHFANRLVYGRRATPYEVLSTFSEHVGGAYSSEEILPQMAAMIGEATGAERAAVWVRVGDELRPAASWPERNGRAAPVPSPASELPLFADGERAFAVRHQGELLGALTVTTSRREPLNPTQEKLLEDLAAQAGLLLRNVRLIEELRASRQRIVSAQDQERRRLERNIHDGAQQQLVALSVKLRLLKALAAKDPAKAGELVDQLQAESQDALENLRDLARGIYPPLLADKGLGAALEAQARKTTLPVTVEQNGIGRYPQEAEAAAYFCVLEALQNSSKHATASAVTVRLSEDHGGLVFEVSDNGEGFDVSAAPAGSGLQNMADRVEALGGTLRVHSHPGEGTTVTGTIPVGATEPTR
jgi:signal transduction histidine kinase